MNSETILKGAAIDEAAAEMDPVAVVALKSCVLGILVLWTVGANGMVFVVLYRFPRLRTVPNFLVGNLAFSDFTLGLLVLPFSAVYAITSQWLFGKALCELWLSLDIFLCTSSIWNLSMIGLDRYWAITDPVRYLSKRTLKTAIIMISCVWALAGAISIAPFLGWKAFSNTGNYYRDNLTETMQCMHFQDLPSFTVYSATGSFWIPLAVMLYVYYRIYKAFREHRANRIYRQKVPLLAIEEFTTAYLSAIEEFTTAYLSAERSLHLRYQPLRLTHPCTYAIKL